MFATRANSVPGLNSGIFATFGPAYSSTPKAVFSVAGGGKKWVRPGKTDSVTGSSDFSRYSGDYRVAKSPRNEEYSGDCDWEASSNQPWVNIVPTKGTLTAGSQAWLEVTITDGIEAYGPGNHNANIEFQGPLFQPSVTSIRMNVIPPPCDLQIDQSDTEVQSVGFAGGPFTPSSVRLTIRNQGGEECRWNALPKERWVDINPLSGTIPKGAVGSLEVAINAEANPLARRPLQPGNANRWRTRKRQVCASKIERSAAFLRIQDR